MNLLFYNAVCAWIWRMGLETKQQFYKEIF